jgi:putative CocE/NonD family hydrolase
MRAHLMDDRAGLRDKPVRIHLGGRDTWLEFDSFPPGPPTASVWHLQPNRRLAQGPPEADNPPDAYRYDPAKPTPNVGGAMFAFAGAGPVDNAPLEKRRDVLVYTSEPIERDLVMIGNVEVALFARSRVADADFLVRLNDVDEKGVSINICDALVRRTGADPVDGEGVGRVTLRLNANAHCFLAGHRLRVVVASGAHPRFARNTGTSETLASATTLVANEIEIFHDPARPSALTLPTYQV